MEKQIKIGYGPMLPTIGNQLYHQGYEFMNQEMESRAELWRDAINRLYIPSFMIESEHNKIVARVQKRILANIRPIAEAND